MPKKAIVGAAAGALFVLIWAAFGFGWAWLVLAFGALGAAIGFVIDRPGALIALLERLQRR